MKDSGRELSSVSRITNILILQLAFAESDIDKKPNLHYLRLIQGPLPTSSYHLSSNSTRSSPKLENTITWNLRMIPIKKYKAHLRSLPRDLSPPPFRKLGYVLPMAPKDESQYGCWLGKPWYWFTLRHSRWDNWAPLKPNGEDLYWYWIFREGDWASVFL